MILTPEQMRAKLAGTYVPPTSENADVLMQRTLTAEQQVERLTRKVAALSQSVKNGKRLTPTEIRQGIDLLFQKYQFSPVEELIITAQNTDDQNLSTRICMFLTEFMLPKLKSVEVSGTVDHQHTVVIRRFGPEGKVVDTPVPRVPGLPLTNAPVKRVEDAINKEIVDV